MPRRKDEDEEDEGNGGDWIGALIALGIGAIAIYFLSKLLDQSAKAVQQDYYSCPQCGSAIKKWSRACSNCGKVLTFALTP